MHTSAGWGERPEHYHRTRDWGGATRPPQERRSPSATTLEILIEGDAASGVACADDGRGLCRLYILWFAKLTGAGLVEIIYTRVCSVSNVGSDGLSPINEFEPLMMSSSSNDSCYIKTVVSP